jgi:hypothetical protein
LRVRWIETSSPILTYTYKSHLQVGFRRVYRARGLMRSVIVVLQDGPFCAAPMNKK